jgi:hypothetical protein
MYIYGRDRNFRPIIHLRPRILAQMNVSDLIQTVKRIAWRSSVADKNINNHIIV